MIMTLNDEKLHIMTTSTAWRLLLQEGVFLDVTTGASLRNLLTGQLGLEADYVEQHVDAVFLDGHPIDDIDMTSVPDGGRVAIAGALPGAAGIAMRRNSPVAALRGGITGKGDVVKPTEDRGRIQMRLFGLVLHTVAHRLLQRGVIVEAARLASFLREDGQAVVLSEGHRVERDAVLTRLAAQGEALVECRIVLGDGNGTSGHVAC